MEKCTHCNCIAGHHCGGVPIGSAKSFVHEINYPAYDAAQKGDGGKCVHVNSICALYALLVGCIKTVEWTDLTCSYRNNDMSGTESILIDVNGTKYYD